MASLNPAPQAAAERRPRGRRDAVKHLFRPVADWAVGRALLGRNRARESPERGRFTRDDVAGLLAEAWRRYDALAPTLPVEPTAGANLNLRLASLTLGLYRALLARGVGPDYARELVADAAWAVYERYARVTRFVSRRLWRVLPPRARARLSDADNLAHRLNPDGTVRLYFPFTWPAYLAVRVPAKAGGIAFDMVRCPVAAFFRSHGEPGLCLAAWCNLDYPLAEMGSRRLVRTTALVAGDDRCDFRFLPAVPPAVPSAVPPAAPGTGMRTSTPVPPSRARQGIVA